MHDWASEHAKAMAKAFDVATRDSRLATCYLLLATPGGVLVVCQTYELVAGTRAKSSSLTKHSAQQRATRNTPTLPYACQHLSQQQQQQQTHSSRPLISQSVPFACAQFANYLPVNQQLVDQYRRPVGEPSFAVRQSSNHPTLPSQRLYCTN
jgi:hypothetical protein